MKKKERKKRKKPAAYWKSKLEKAENVWRLPCIACAFRSHRLTDMNQIRIKDAYKNILSYSKN